MNTNHERQKWDHYYASLPSTDEDENIIRFREEFTSVVADLLPEGGWILEAGCGGGEQSLALAKTGKYQLTLLDFSAEALEKARLAFDREGLQAEFLLEDAFRPGNARFDLVFNAGVLEHYSTDQQGSLLRGMASRSEKYVLALAPNFRNYWYWLWRAHKTSQNQWPFGREVPALDLSGAFEAAGMRYLGSAFLGQSWTESFISGVDGMADDLKGLLLQIHRGGILPAAQTSYLVAALGGVDEVSAPPGWGDLPEADRAPAIEALTAALTDALALQVEARREARVARDEYLARLADMSTQLMEQKRGHTIGLMERVQEIERQTADELVGKIQEIERRFDERVRQIEQQSADDLTCKVQEIERRFDERVHQIEQARASDLAEQIGAIERDGAEQLVGRLREIERRNAEALIEKLKEIEYQQVFDYTGLVRQIEHDHTGVLIGKIREIEHLRAQIEALHQPPTPILSQQVKSFLIRIFTKLGLLSYAIELKKNLKKARHLFRKKIPSEASYQPPISLGHPAIPPERRVVILTYTFFDFDGGNMYCGGAERYVLELARLIRELGFFPELYQCGNGYWVRYYRDLRVTGLDVGGEAERLAAEYRKLPHQQALTIFSPFSLAISAGEGRSVGISHGVFWDYPDFQANRPAMQAVWDSCRNLEIIVSVDTNTINWVRASAAGLAEKFVYIPNFVDVDVFEPAPLTPHPAREEDARSVGDRITILYPRRLYRPRGFWLVAEVLPKILERYPQVEFFFVGRADKPEADYVCELTVCYPGRVRWEILPPEEMPQAYRQAHITVAPTLHSEGTSLSCLEAMASGNAVIATNVGGLPNLILPYHNGLLIDASADALENALVELIENPALRQQIAQRGREAAAAFSIERWRAQWREILAQRLVAGERVDSESTKVAFFPIAPGIPWEGIKQRPHHLAMQLARAGIETFWGNPTRRQASPHPLLHILGPREETHFSRPLIFVYYPFTYRAIHQYDDPFVVYDVLDDPSIHETSDQALPVGRRAIDYHRKLLAEADLVIASSSVLVRRLEPQRPDVLLIPNGVDLAHFRPDDLRAHDKQADTTGKPRIGFHGAIAEWFDVDLACEIARLRPDYQFEFIGPASVDTQQLRRLPNVIVRDAVAYEEIPRHIARFDVGILPFHLDALTQAVRPLKVLEYLAMGKPVVAAPLEEIEGWPGVLTARDPQDFAAQIDHALAIRDAISSDEQVQDFVVSASWQKTTQPLIALLDEAFRVSSQ
ncbi:MAG: glycosyltransferase [Chloroflexi bacterium]|nr:glycosyltransferase [Chloroflexota bacterium]